MSGTTKGQTIIIFVNTSLFSMKQIYRIQYIKVKTKYAKTKRFLRVQHNRMMSMLFRFNSNKPMANYYQTTKLYTRPCCFGLFQKLQRYRSALNLNIRLTIVGGKLRKIFKRILCPSAFSLAKATLSFPRNMCIYEHLYVENLHYC